jgi:rubrerythrin
VDELEAVRLADFEGLEHLEASERMGISRSTFTRLVEKARRKVAEAIVEGKDLVIEGGHVEFAAALYRCRHCGDVQSGPNDEDADLCPECGSTDIENLTRCCMGRRGRRLRR